MKLIIGGAFQGKLEYATTQYGLADGWIDGADCVLEAIEGCRGIFHFEAWVRRLLQERAEEGQAWELTVERLAATVAERLYEKNPDSFLPGLSHLITQSAFLSSALSAVNC